jgi:hypothetical protein
MHPDGGFVLVSFGGPAIWHWDGKGTELHTLAEGPGGFDGVEVLADGRVLISSWSDNAVHELHGGTLRPLIREVNSPADIGVDTRRNQVAIPLFNENRVEIWSIPAAR